jgi:outer membrane protein TolC
MPALAQDTLPLTLRKAVEIATAPEGNTRLELAREAISQAEARRLQARAALLPNIDGSVGYQDATRNLRAFGIQFPSIPGLAFSTFAGPFGIFDARSSLSQSVFDLSSIRRYQTARSTVDTAKQERESARHQVTDQVARAYLAALRAEAHLETAQANLELAERLLRLARSQKDAGTGTGIEITRAEVQVANEKQRLQAAVNERNRSHLQLLRALDLRLDTKLQLSDRLGYHVLEPISYDQAIKIASENRPDYKSQQQREASMKLQFDSVKFERLPSLAAFADYGSIGPAINDSRATRSVGVALRVPIFDGGRRDARRTEAASQLRTEAIRTRDIRQQLELELRLAFDNLTSAELQVATAVEGLRLSQKELEQAERRYRAGVTTSVEVTDAQTRLVRAQENHISALFQHNLARLDLGSAMGQVDRFLP